MSTDSNSGRARRYKDSILRPLREKNRILYTLTILAGIVLPPVVVPCARLGTPGGRQHVCHR